MPTRNINLTEHFDRFVGEQIERGSYRNASEVMRAALRLLEQHSREQEQKIELLKSMASEAFGQIDCGQGIEFDNPRQVENFIKEIGRDAGPSQKRRSKRA
jgi:antitoxin ParD1/3/4